MRFETLITCIALSGILFSLHPLTACAKTHHTYKRSRHYLVPPPPPVVLPSSWTAVHGAYQVSARPTNPYRKYVYAKEGYEDPAPVKVNKHVTYWNLQQN